MNKTELVEALAASAGIAKVDAQVVVDVLFDPETGVIGRTLRKNQKVQITGFGTFEARRRNARTGRNPRTGEKIRIPAGRAVIFRTGKGLKNAVNRAAR